MNDNILQFLIKARQSTYASGVKAEVVNEMKAYVIKEGNLEYRDSYYDQHLIFQGQEVLLQDDKPIWSMSYRGAAIDNFDSAEIFKVLQKLIKEHANKVRFNGDFEIEEGKYKYICNGNGSLCEFSGKEEIHKDGKLAHWMNYFGGDIK